MTRAAIIKLVAQETLGISFEAGHGRMVHGEIVGMRALLQLTVTRSAGVAAMTQGAELLIRVVPVFSAPALLPVVGRWRAIVTLQAVLFQLVACRAGARLAYRHGTMAAGDELLTVRHLLPLVTHLAGIRSMTKITKLRAGLVPVRLTPVRLLVRWRRARTVALLAVRLAMTLGAGLGIGLRRLSVRRAGPTARVRHGQLVARLALALLVAKGAVGAALLARHPVPRKPIPAVGSWDLVLVARAAELALMTKVAFLLVPRDGLA